MRLVNSHDARDRDKIAGDVLSEGKNEDWLLALGAYWLWIAYIQTPPGPG